MHPFLSSPSFEIGLWTRQKQTGEGEEASGAPDTSASPSAVDEVERLRKQLLLERSRIAEQSAEIERLRAGTSLEQKPDQEAASTVPDPGTEQEDAPIPDKLWREPLTALTNGAPDSDLPLDKPWDQSHGASDSSGSAAAVKSTEKSEKEPTITVKAGDQEIVLQISKDTTLAPSSALDGVGEEADGPNVDASSNGTQGLSVRVNSTELSADQGRENGDKGVSGATQITVRSGQQSIVIQVRDGSGEEVKLPLKSIAAEKELPQNVSSPSAVGPAPTEVETVKAVPELPEPTVSRAKQDEWDGAPEKTALRGAMPSGQFAERYASSVPEESSTTKGYSAYANLALRTR